MEYGCRTPSVQRGRAARLARNALAGRDQKPFDSNDLPVEVARVEFLPPNDLVDLSQVGHRELRLAESRCQRGVLELAASAFDRVGDDLLVIEGDLGAGPENLFDRHQ